MVLDQGKKRYPNPTTIAESLVADGADHNDANQDGLTCLMYAARNGHLPVAELLLKSGAKVDLQTEVRTASMQHACGKKN